MDLTFLILIFVFGALIGFFTAYLFQSSKGEEKTASLEEAPQSPSSFKDPSAIEFARLLGRTGKPGLQIEMDGQKYTSPEQIDETLRNRLRCAAQELSIWINPASGKPEEARHEKDAPPPPSSIRVNPPAPIKPAGGSEVRPISMNPLDIFVPGGQSKADTRLKSLAEQIDEVLQEQIEGSELYSGIHLADSPGKGLLVIIGSETYEGIEAIPNPDIRSLIKGAVQEWERRTSIKK